jgi:hypothetical protein
MTWRHFKSYVTYSATAQSTYGIRVLNGGNPTSLLSDAVVDVRANAVVQSGDSSIEAVRIDNADVDVEHIRVNVDSSRVSQATAFRIYSNDGNHVVRADDVNLRIQGLQVPVGGFASISGILAVNSAPQLTRAKVEVVCTAGGTYECSGVTRRINVNQGSLQSGLLTLDHSDVSVTQVNAADSTAGTFGFIANAPARITGSTIRIQRSPFGENNSAVLANGTGNTGVLSSTLLVDSSVQPTVDCYMGGNAGIELYGSVVQGNSCASGTLACGGNAKKNGAFSASTCP